MRSSSKKRLGIWLVVLSVGFFTPHFLRSGPAEAKNIDSATGVQHHPIQFFVPGYRIQLETMVTDKAGIKLVRCYFRAKNLADFVFVPMNVSDKNKAIYRGIIPAPDIKTASVEYLFLVVNSQNQVVKTQTFVAEADTDEDVPAWQKIKSEGTIQVSSEMAEAPRELAGFSDQIAMDVTESSARFGLVVGGIYGATAGGSAGGAGAASAAGAKTSTGTVSGEAAQAKSMGAVQASSGAPGTSTTMIVGGVLGGAALVGLAAAAGGGGGGSSSSTQPAPAPTPPPSTPPPTPTSPCSDKAGSWSGSFINQGYSKGVCNIKPDCEKDGKITESGNWNMTLKPDCSGTIIGSITVTYNVCSDLYPNTSCTCISPKLEKSFGIDNSSVRVNGNEITFNDSTTYCGRINGTGTLTGSTLNGTYQYDYGSGTKGYWAGSKR
jgi:hypothetical protein